VEILVCYWIWQKQLLLEGIFDTAYERAKSAQLLLILERKGNIGLFVYLYWYYIVLFIVVLILISVLTYRIYKKRSIASNIRGLNKQEESIRVLITSLQKRYFAGKISVGDF